MRSLYELTVSVRDDDDLMPRHLEITVEPAVNADNFTEFFAPGVDETTVIDPALREAGRYHAGVLGRLGLSLVPWIDYERARHRCELGGPSEGYFGGTMPPLWGQDTCTVSHGGVLTPGDEDCFQPSLWLYVPRNKRKDWLTRVEDGLTEIVKDATS